MYIERIRNGHHECNDGMRQAGISLHYVGLQTLCDGALFAIPPAPRGLGVLAIARGSGMMDDQRMEKAAAAIWRQPRKTSIRASAPLTFAYASLQDDLGVMDELAMQYITFESVWVLERLVELLGDAARGRDRFERAFHAFGLLMACARGVEGCASNAYPVLVRQALAIMEEDYPYIFGIEELSASLEVSKHHLIRQFTQSVGISPGKKLAQIRMDHAKQLLMDKEYSVEIVGQMVGYANGNYFSKVFREHTGISPKAYRGKYAGI